MGNPKHTEVSVARQSPQRPDADEPELDDTTGAVEPDETDGPSASVDRALWDELRIDPVEIALPAGTGFTLRAYRPASSLTPTDVTERDLDDPFLARRQVIEEEEDDETVVILDEDLAEEFADDEDESKRRRRDGATDTDAADDEAEADEDATDEADDEEVPVFLSNQGKLLLFKTPSRWSVSSGPVRQTICPNWTAGMNCPNGWSPRISRPSTRTPTSSTSSWRTCAAGTTPGIRPC